MPLINDADAVYKGSVPVDMVYAGATRVWPKVPPPQWQPVGSFGAFDWFHQNSSRVPSFLPPWGNTTMTCWFDRNQNSLFINNPSNWTGSMVGTAISADWPAEGMAHPDPRNPTNYQLVLDCEWTISSQDLKEDLHTCWAYWSSNLPEDYETTDHWGVWEMRGFYPTSMHEPTTTRTAPTGNWILSIFNLTPFGTFHAGLIQLKNPTMTWYQLLPVTE